MWFVFGVQSSASRTVPVVAEGPTRVRGRRARRAGGRCGRDGAALGGADGLAPGAAGLHALMAIRIALAITRDGARWETGF